MKIIFILFLYFSPAWSLSQSSRIIGGQEANAGQFPYAAAIYKTTTVGNFFCTGCIINSNWVLTAAQCVDGARSFTILVGTHKLSGDTETVKRYATETYIVHPDYNPNTLENDIGFIKFREPIPLNQYVSNINLPFADMPGGVAFGWGQVSDTDPDLADTLRYVTLYNVSDAECGITYGSQLPRNVACFEGNYNEGTCFGDSGSPITVKVGIGLTVVIAVASFFSGNGCESTDPSGFTKLFPFLDWLYNVTSL